MKILVTILIACSAVAGELVPRLAWRVDTDEKPTPHRLDLVFGETVRLECKFLNYQQPMDISGASVILHARTNGMAEGISWQTAGFSTTNGLALVDLDVSSWIPRAASNSTWTIEVSQTNAAKILRAYGPLFVTGTALASTNDPFAISAVEAGSRLDIIPSTNGWWSLIQINP